MAATGAAPAALLDALVFGNVWVAAAAALLAAASSVAMGLAPRASALALAFCGTLAVYAVDRLADLERDRATAPRRSAFVARHVRALRTLAATSAAAAVVAALAAGRAAVLLAAAVLALGLAHRRLKRVPFAKAVYIAAAWTAVTAGVPAVTDPRAVHAGLVATVLFATLLANAAASSARDQEAGAALLGTPAMLAIARGWAAAALVAAMLAPEPVRALVPVPLLTLAALVAWRPGERYGLVVVDGALAAGALFALLW